MQEFNKASRSDGIVEAALGTYPLVPAPPTLAPAILARIHARPNTLRFQLSWIDQALALLAVSMIGVPLLLLAWWRPEVLSWYADLPPALAPLLTPDVMLAVAGTAGGLVILCGCLIVTFLVIESDRVWRYERI